MRFTLLAPLMLLAGCAGDPPPKIEVAKTLTVEVPVAVACVTTAQLPNEPAQVGAQLTGNAAHDVMILATADLQLRAALNQSLALLQACVIAGAK